MIEKDSLSLNLLIISKGKDVLLTLSECLYESLWDYVNTVENLFLCFLLIMTVKFQLQKKKKKCLRAGDYLIISWEIISTCDKGINNLFQPVKFTSSFMLPPLSPQITCPAGKHPGLVASKLFISRKMSL